MNTFVVTIEDNYGFSTNDLIDNNSEINSRLTESKQIKSVILLSATNTR